MPSENDPLFFSFFGEERGRRGKLLIGTLYQMVFCRGAVGGGFKKPASQPASQPVVMVSGTLPWI